MNRSMIALIVLAAVPCLVLASSLSITYQVLDSQIRPGAETSVLITLSNPSATTSISGVKLYITGGDYLSFPSNYLEIGTIDASESQMTNIIVKASDVAQSKVSYINVKATYSTGSSSGETNVNIPVTIARAPILQVTGINYSSQPEPGRTVTMYLQISNNGDGAAKDVRIKMNESNIFVSETQEAFISSIAQGTKAIVPFSITVDPDSDVKTHLIPLTLTYSDEQKTHTYTEQKSFGLRVSGSRNIIVTLENQEILAHGKSGLVTIRIANGGTAPANYLSIIVDEANPQTKYVGNIGSDDYDTEKLSVTIPPDAKEGDYELIISLKYKDAFGEEHVEEYPLTVAVSSVTSYNMAKSGFGLGTIVFILAILAAAGYFIRKRFLRKK